MKWYVVVGYFLGSLVSVLVSNWALKPITLVSYLLWIALGPITLAGFVSLGGWSWKGAGEIGLIYAVATVVLALCYRIGSQNTGIAKWITRLVTVTVWLLCAGYNLWILGMST